MVPYRRENPGSKLKTAVTGDPEPGSKDAKRESLTALALRVSKICITLIALRLQINRM